MSRGLVAAALALCLTASAAPRPERLYLGPGSLLGSNRMVSLSGAYAGIGEGLDGFTSNVASAAHRSAHRTHDWDLNLAFSYLLTPASLGRDVDNDGQRDEALRATQLLFGVLVQFGPVGLGAYGHNRLRSFCLEPTCAEPLGVSESITGLGAGLGLFKDQLVLGVGLTSNNASFEGQLPTGMRTELYSGTSLQAGVLVKPQRQPFRVGAAVKQEVNGTYRGGGEPADWQGRPLFSGLATPFTASLGVSFRVGKGASFYNQLPTGPLTLLPDEPVPDADRGFDAPPGRMAVALQADASWPVGNATHLGVLTRNDAPEPVGARFLVTPRLGLEHETWVRRLRLRAGSYLEPSPFPGRDARPHLTFGLDLFLFRLVDDWTATIACDLASRYSNVGFGLRVWR